MIEIFKMILKEENINDKKEILRNILSFFLIGIFFVEFIAPYLDINIKSGRNISLGLIAITFYYVFTFMYSKLKSRRTSLYKVLPFKSLYVFIGYINVLFINCILKRIILFLLPVYVYTIYNNYANINYFILDFIKVNMLIAIGLFLALIFSLELLNKKIIVPVCSVGLSLMLLNEKIYENIIILLILFFIFGILAYYFFNNDFRFIISTKAVCSKTKMSFFKREFLRFYREKVIFINHISTLAVTFVLTFTYIISERELNASGYLVLLLPNIITTTSIMFSIEKDYVNLIKSLPINYKKIFISKYIFLLTIIIPYYIVVFLVMKIVKVSGMNFMIFMLLISNLLISTLIKMAIDYLKPLYDFNHVKQLLENKRRYYFYLISIIYGLPILLIDLIGITNSFCMEGVLFVISIFIIKNMANNKKNG